MSANKKLLAIAENNQEIYNLLKGLYEETITELNITKGVTSIRPWMFYHNQTLEKVNIPNSVETINQDAFYYCSNLNTVSLGKNLTTINKRAFTGCSSLTNIYLNSTKINDFTEGNSPFNTNTVGNSNISLTIGNNCKTIPAYMFESKNIENMSFAGDQWWKWWYYESGKYTYYYSPETLVDRLTGTSSSSFKKTWQRAYTTYDYDDTQVSVQASTNTDDIYRKILDFYNVEIAVTGGVTAGDSLRTEYTFPLSWADQLIDWTDAGENIGGYARAAYGLKLYPDYTNTVKGYCTYYSDFINYRWTWSDYETYRISSLPDTSLEKRLYYMLQHFNDITPDTDILYSRGVNFIGAAELHSDETYYLRSFSAHASLLEFWGDSMEIKLQGKNVQNQIDLSVAKREGAPLTAYVIDEYRELGIPTANGTPPSAIEIFNDLVEYPTIFVDEKAEYIRQCLVKNNVQLQDGITWTELGEDSFYFQFDI